jgi:ribosomal 30S subunit maturation factor RimM
VPAGSQQQQTVTDKAASSRLLLVGRVLAPYGVKGWVKVEPFT